MEVFLTLIGMAVFYWFVTGGPQQVMTEWRKGKEAESKCRCKCHQHTAD
jgi:hypothetical protein